MERSTWPHILLLLLLASTTLSSAQNRHSKNVQVALRAKWPGTSLLLEAGELLSKEWKDYFWDFTETWIKNENDNENNGKLTARECVEKIVKYGRDYVSEPLASLFEFSLTLRSASPRLVLYRQLAEESLSSFPLADELSEAGVHGLDVKESGEKKVHDPWIVGSELKVPSGRCCWVDTGGPVFFDVLELQLWLDGSEEYSGDSFQQPEVFEFDHIYYESNISSPVAILYGALGTECFADFHVTLAEASKKGKVFYVVRPVLPSNCQKQIDQCGAVGTRDYLNLGGYGVELAMKNMEYNVMDDSTIKKDATAEDPQTENLSTIAENLELNPEISSDSLGDEDNLQLTTISDTLDVWELKDLGHQAAQKIVHSSHPLQSMQEINQNFPSLVSSLSRIKLNVSVKNEIVANQRMIPPGKSLMALNGGLVNIEDLDLYMLLDLVHQELSLADQFSKMKIPRSTIRRLLQSPAHSSSSMFRIDFRSSHVHYLNNLEEDAIYRKWRSNLNEILMPVFPGQLRYIRKNLFHAVYVFDPALSCGSELVEIITSLYENNFPVRFGVILYSSKFIKKVEKNVGLIESSEIQNDGSDISDMIIRLFIHIKEDFGPQTAFQFLGNINKLRAESDDTSEDALEMHHVDAAFVETLISKSKSPPQDLLLKLINEESFKDLSQESSLFVYQLGLAKLQCSLLFNGLVYESSEEAVISAMNEELPRLQEQVYYGHINSQTDVLDKFLSENGIRRYNPQIIGDGKVKPRFISHSASVVEKDTILSEVSYLHSPESIENVKPITHLLVVDVTSKTGLKLLHEGIRYLTSGSTTGRIGVIFSSKNNSSLSGLLFAKVYDMAASTYGHKKKVLNFLDALCSFYESEFNVASSVATIITLDFVDKICELASANDIPSEGFRSALSNFFNDKAVDHSNKVARFLHRRLGLESGDNAVITNGKVLHAADESSILSDDLHLLETVELKQRVSSIAEAIDEVEWLDIDPDLLTSKFISDIVMAVSSSMALRNQNPERARFEVLSADHSAIILHSENSSIHIDAVLDPLSPSGQKVSSLLWILQKYTQPSMRLVLNPLSSLVDLPLKNFYRYVLPTLDDFSKTDASVHGPKALFSNMPLSKTLTMNLDVPEPWLVEPVIAVHDLDNILLENLGDTRTLQAVFELQALALTGHCSEKDLEPPRGLQLILGTKDMPHLVDTIVMANLGYWQMKVFPGVWYLQLAPGRSSELYHLKNDVSGSHEIPMSKRITINDLRGKVVHMEVVKKQGKEHEKLLLSTDADDHTSEQKTDESGWNSNIFKWVTGLVGGKQTKKSEDTALGKGGRSGKTINIFSIASGHLYERFLKIMILSVLKNTRRPVKFWFINNYLSPQFKNVIPHMASEYGFQYELITYKWPTWLHKQKEKQRIIWAYKILFLDVIFPLSLEKVIFVDADQIVRADMGELYDMDLKGRPYGYTPFCDNNKEMDGYRFWRQGFWKEHLRGRPYHISALYVVDLVKFRETAAGDNLRVIYESLSKDPNSLSNLDQDLPNYAQQTVPIFSLPQEWLWCESWCGNATKSKAKTIDLCNNPMTKEPKLQGARRIVPEWSDLDFEARKFTAKITGEILEEPVTSLPQSPNSTPQITADEKDLETQAEL